MRGDHLPLRRVDQIKFIVGNARQSAYFYRNAFGFDVTAYAALETGMREEAWYVLQQGKIKSYDKEWEANFTFKRLHEAYTDHAKELGLRRPLTKEMLGRRIRKFTHIDEQRPDNAKPREYLLQPLEECRRVFEAFLGVAISWNDIEEQNK